MHSFNDIHDFNDSGRASHRHDPDHVPANQLERNTLFLELPIELKYNPILSIPSAIDPSLIRQQQTNTDEGTHLSAFFPVTRLPLLLADTAKQMGGSSDFQSNGAFSFSTPGRTSDVPNGKPNGLGLHLDINEENIMSSDFLQGPPTASSVSSEGSFCYPSEASSLYLTAHDPFDDWSNFNFSSSGSMHSDELAQCQESDIAFPFSATGFKMFNETDPLLCRAFSSPSRTFDVCASSKAPSSFTGLVADINMYDRKEDDNNICVRPQDLFGDNPTLETLEVQDEPEYPKSIKVEEHLGDSIGSSASPPAVSYLRAPQPDWPQIPTEHLPFLVERYLAHFVTQPCTTSEVFCEADVKHDMPFASLDPAPYPCTPISAEILEAVEEAKPSNAYNMPREKLADKTNVLRPGPGSRTGINIMNMCDPLIPQDVTLDRAHEGVPIVVVAQKTKYFMMMHPGERLSEDLLFSFAGRLSTSGQTMPGYRCYVQGCSKTTKRKDHMADHVRTHLGEKPFQCSVCGMGFIRNNDCQRHENNHRPDKKFVCPCKAAFSRRDLFVRHQKTACILSSSLTGCFRRPRKIGKASSTGRKDTPDGDDASDFDYIPRNSPWVTAGA